MREALFIKKNKDSWERIQRADTHQNADETARDFIKLVDDLGYARTFYPSSKVTRFVNLLASKIYLGIYRNRREASSRLVTFWKYELPMVIRKHHLTILACFILFSLFFAVGFFSARNDPSFINEALDEEYVKMTQENIERGNPFGVYQTGSAALSWLGIMLNNIAFSLKIFAQGLLFGIFTIKALVSEGIRIGAFEEYFFERGLGVQSILTVFIHGTLEITAIIVSGAAGVVLGKSFLFPGTIRRLDSLKKGAKDGVKIVIGLVPVFIVAAFFEGFVTRHYTMHWSISGSILLVSLSFVIWYFVIYPIQVQRKMEPGYENQ